jgi:hypothetical protein
MRYYRLGRSSPDLRLGLGDRWITRRPLDEDRRSNLRVLGYERARLGDSCLGGLVPEIDSYVAVPPLRSIS